MGFIQNRIKLFWNWVDSDALIKNVFHFGSHFRRKRTKWNCHTLIWYHNCSIIDRCHQRMKQLNWILPHIRQMLASFSHKQINVFFPFIRDWHEMNMVFFSSSKWTINIVWSSQEWCLAASSRNKSKIEKWKRRRKKNKNNIIRHTLNDNQLLSICKLWIFLHRHSLLTFPYRTHYHFQTFSCK